MRTHEDLMPCRRFKSVCKKGWARCICKKRLSYRPPTCPQFPKKGANLSEISEFFSENFCKLKYFATGMFRDYTLEKQVFKQNQWLFIKKCEIFASGAVFQSLYIIVNVDLYFASLVISISARNTKSFPKYTALTWLLDKVGEWFY